MQYLKFSQCKQLPLPDSHSWPVSSQTGCVYFIKMAETVWKRDHSKHFGGTGGKKVTAKTPQHVYFSSMIHLVWIHKHVPIKCSWSFLVPFFLISEAGYVDLFLQATELHPELVIAAFNVLPWTRFFKGNFNMRHVRAQMCWSCRVRALCLLRILPWTV